LDEVPGAGLVGRRELRAGLLPAARAVDEDPGCADPGRVGRAADDCDAAVERIGMCELRARLEKQAVG